MADQQTSKKSILSSEPKRGFAKICRNSEGGQVFVETLFVFLTLIFIFNFLHLRAEKQKESLSKYHFKGGR